MTQAIDVLGENRKQIYHLRVVTKVFFSVTQNPEAVKEKHIEDTFSQGKNPQMKANKLRERFEQRILYTAYSLNG